uniref:Uncharacterized protein n=1 Tax=Zea mays TaxID=4577 RepID=B8A0Z4_MAIZE|nr:unknown [Zea mays]
MLSYVNKIVTTRLTYTTKYSRNYCISFLSDLCTSQGRLTRDSTRLVLIKLVG